MAEVTTLYLIRIKHILINNNESNIHTIHNLYNNFYDPSITIIELRNVLNKGTHVLRIWETKQNNYIINPKIWIYKNSKCRHYIGYYNSCVYNDVCCFTHGKEEELENNLSCKLLCKYKPFNNDYSVRGSVSEFEYTSDSESDLINSNNKLKKDIININSKIKDYISALALSRIQIEKINMRFKNTNLNNGKLISKCNDQEHENEFLEKRNLKLTKKNIKLTKKNSKLIKRKQELKRKLKRKRSVCENVDNIIFPHFKKSKDDPSLRKRCNSI